MLDWRRRRKNINNYYVRLEIYNYYI